ncbi:hypothetical protein SCUP515_03502 [Seiridium cupressi]
MMALWNPLQTFFSGSGPAASTAAPLQLRIVSFNIRYATSSPFAGERPWEERAPHVTNQILHEVRFANVHGPQTKGSAGHSASGHASAFVCLQEVLHTQLVDVLAALNGLPTNEKGDEPAQGPHWAHIGVGRDDGEKKGEYSPIIYPVNTFNVLHYDTVWLSPTPDKPSKGWDAGSIRILTIGVFEHKQTKERLVAANTHLDDQSSKSRFESVKIILDTLRKVHQQWSQGRKLAVFLTGDFNSFPDQEAYMSMKEDGWLSDLHEEIPPRDRYGENVTFTGFQPDKWKDERGRIDYIWFGPNDKSSGNEALGNPWKPIGYAILPNVFDNKVYLSDHRAVVGDLHL